MSALRGLGHLTRAHLLEVFRSRTALFWTLAFPVVWVLIMGAAFGGGDPERVTFLMPAVFTITLITGTFFSVTFRMVAERQNGILRRYRVTPVTALTVVLAHAATSFVGLSISMLLQCVTGWLVFDVRLAGGVGPILAVLLAGELAFVPLGLFVGSVARDSRTAPALTHLIFFPMMFLSGAAVPFHALPGWVQAAGRVLPATWFMEAMHAVAVRGEPLGAAGVAVAILLATAVVASAVNALVFRWESMEPLRPKAVLAALGVLVVLFAGAALAAPPVRMAQDPAEPAIYEPMGTFRF